MKVPINKKRKSTRNRTPRPTPLMPRGKKARRQFELLSGASVGMLTIVIVLTFAASGVVPKYAMRFPQVASVVSSVIADLTNGDRASHQLQTLKVNPVLVAAAQAKADDMAAKGYFAHTAPDGTDPWHWFEKVGYEYAYAGENLAIDFSDSLDVERAWMNSPTHRENILNEHFTEIGIAVAVGMYQGRMTTFVVQAFGTPKGAQTTQAQTAVVPADPEDPAIAATEGSPIAQMQTSDEGEPSVAKAMEGEQVLGTSASEPQTAAVEIAQNAIRREIEAVAPKEAIDPEPIAQAPQKPPFWAYMIGVPHAALKYSYYFLSLFVLVALAYTTRFEMRRHHIRHATGAGYLLGLMGTLLIVAHYTIFTQPVLAAVIGSN
ncbi:hypothetical protein HYT05_00680 [Candidatus Kaiserbacteria bacterium]|nr:hypothetical protein [Candidatus Kaiserbacteria bacterium]